MKFQVFKDVSSQYRWRMVAANGRIIAVSGEGYHNKKDCTDAIDLVKRFAPIAPVEDLTASASAGYYR